MEDNETKRSFNLIKTILNIAAVFTARKGRLSYVNILLKVYSSLVVLAMLANFARMCLWFGVAEKFGSRLIRRIVFFCFHGQVPFQYLILMKFFDNTHKFLEAVRQADQTIPIDRDAVGKLGFLLKKSPYCITKYMTTIYILNVVGGGFSIIVFQFYFLYLNELTHIELIRDIYYPFRLDDSMTAIFLIIFYGILLFYLMGFWMLLAILLGTSAFILCQRFKLQSDRLVLSKQHLINDIHEFDLEKERLHYEHLITAIDAVDELLFLPIGITFLVVFGSFCPIIYNVVYSGEVSTMFVWDLLVVMSALLIAFCLLAICVILSSSAHSSKKVLFSFDMRKLDSRSAQQLQLFIMRSHGESLGLTFLKLFTMDQTAVTTVVGVLLTYSVVVLQFHPGGINDVRDACLAMANSTCSCDCSAAAQITSRLNSSAYDSSTSGT